MEHLRKFFQQQPVIPAVRDGAELDRALASQAVAVFVLAGDILQLPELMEKARERDKLLFLHLDLLQGIGKDNMGVEFLAQKGLCDGIVTTRSNLIVTARKAGLIAVQRLFLLDSAALKTGGHLVLKNEPDAVEILPAVAAPYFLEHVDNLPCPVIAGGLIRNGQEVQGLLAKGVLAISTSEKSLW